MANARFSRSSFYKQICCFALAIHLLNFSVDPKDSAPNYVPENLSFNDIESIAEFFCEEVFGFTNAFDESDEGDPESETVASSFTTFFFISSSLDVKPIFITSPHIRYLIKDSTGFDLFESEITIPPPRAA
jgi:hypothetical protein